MFIFAFVDFIVFVLVLLCKEVGTLIIQKSTVPIPSSSMVLSHLATSGFTTEVSGPLCLWQFFWMFIDGWPHDKI